MPLKGEEVIGLSKDQIEKAAEAAYRNLGQKPWKDLPYSAREYWFAVVKSAAPFLQMPIAEVSEDEAHEVWAKFHTSPVRPYHMSLLQALNELLIKKRNLALQPKPDMREQINHEIATLMYKANAGAGFSSETAGEFLNRILSIIDAHKGEK